MNIRLCELQNRAKSNLKIMLMNDNLEELEIN